MLIYSAAYESAKYSLPSATTLFKYVIYMGKAEKICFRARNCIMLQGLTDQGNDDIMNKN